MSKFIDFLWGSLKNAWYDLTDQEDKMTIRDKMNHNAMSNAAQDILGETADKIEEKAEEVLPGIHEAIGEENPLTPEIPDNTKENIEIDINGNNTADIMQFMKDQQAEQWEREDQIRKETQEREDTAWQRSVEDMQKAGINPNLVNAQPAASGGGITQATGLNYSMYQEEIKTQLTLLEQMIDNDFNASEEQKNRFTDILQSLMMLMAFKK